MELESYLQDNVILYTMNLPNVSEIVFDRIVGSSIFYYKSSLFTFENTSSFQNISFVFVGCPFLFMPPKILLYSLFTLRVIKQNISNDREAIFLMFHLFAKAISLYVL